MPVIGVIGANGQVGSEVCLYLTLMEDVTVIPICRTKLASAFLRRCGLSCRHGSVENLDEASQLLAGCDLIADFSLPKGDYADVRASVNKIIRNAIRFAPATARYVYASSMMVYGMGSRSTRFRWHVLPRSIYGSSKRYAEWLVRRLKRQIQREIYILRLGQVHGELQSASRLFLQGMKSGPTKVPDSSSYTVFCFTIAEALAQIARGKEKPGTYTLVSSPEWSWKEFHEFVARKAGTATEVGCVREVVVGLRAHVAAGLGWFLAPINHFLERNRELLAARMLFAFPSTERRLRARRLVQKASIEIQQRKTQKEYRPYSIFWGQIPGHRLRSLSDSRQTMAGPAEQVRELLGQVVSRQRDGGAAGTGQSDSNS